MFYGTFGDLDFDPWLWKWNAKDPKELTSIVQNKEDKCSSQGKSLFATYLRCGQKISHWTSNPC